MASFLLYLADVEEGGETCFPREVSLRFRKALLNVHITGYYGIAWYSRACDFEGLVKERSLRRF